MMRLSNTPPKGAGKPQGVTKTDRLIRHIHSLGNDTLGKPVGIRNRALSEATGVAAKSIPALLAGAIKHGDVLLCKVTPASGNIENEYRRGTGVPAPEFKPLATQRSGIAAFAHGATTRPLPVTTPAPKLAPREIETPVLIKHHAQPAVARNTGSPGAEPASDTPPAARAVAAARQTPGKALERRGIGPAPAPRPAGDAPPPLRLAINQDGELQMGDDDDPARWVFPIEQVMQLGDFLHGTQGVWRP